MRSSKGLPDKYYLTLCAQHHPTKAPKHNLGPAYADAAHMENTYVNWIKLDLSLDFVGAKACSLIILVVVLIHKLKDGF